MYQQAPYKNVEVLIVDDDPAVREILNRNVLNMGYGATVAHNAEKAVEYFSTKRFNIMVTDIKMGKMDGTVLSETLRTRHPSLGIVFVTGNPTSKTMVAAQRVSAVQYIAKPIDMHELAEALVTGARWNVAQMLSRCADRYFDIRKGRLSILSNKIQHIKSEVKNIVMHKRDSRLLTEFLYTKNPQNAELFRLLDEKMANYLRTL